MKQVLIRRRRKAGYRRPNNLEELAELILENPSLAPMLKGVVRHGNDTALLFSTDELLRELNDRSELYMDGTFEVTLYAFII